MSTSTRRSGRHRLAQHRRAFLEREERLSWLDSSRMATITRSNSGAARAPSRRDGRAWADRTIRERWRCATAIVAPLDRSNRRKTARCRRPSGLACARTHPASSAVIRAGGCARARGVPARRCARRATLHDVLRAARCRTGDRAGHEVERSARRARTQKIAADDSTRILSIGWGCASHRPRRGCSPTARWCAAGSCSTNVTCARAARPAPRSRARRCPQMRRARRAPTTNRPSTLNSVSRRRSDVGRTARPVGAASRRPFSRPAMMRIGVIRRRRGRTARPSCCERYSDERGRARFESSQRDGFAARVFHQRVVAQQIAHAQRRQALTAASRRNRPGRAAPDRARQSQTHRWSRQARRGGPGPPR